MVVVQRNEISRARVVCFLTIFLSIAVLIDVFLIFSGRSQPVQLVLFLFGIAASTAIVLSIIQIYSSPKRSQLILFHREDEMVVATNAIHEGFKLRFLRDVLGENVTSF